MSFIASIGITCSDSISHNRVQVLSIPVLSLACSQATPVDSIKDIVQSSMKVPEFNIHLKKAGGHIDQNVVEITIKMKTIVWKPLMIKNHQALSQKFRQLIVSNVWRLSDELHILLSRVFHYFHDHGKSIQSCWIGSQVTKILQNIWLTLVFSSCFSHTKTFC